MQPAIGVSAASWADSLAGVHTRPEAPALASSGSGCSVRRPPASRGPKTTTAGDLARGKPVWVDADADDSEVLRLMEEH